MVVATALASIRQTFPHKRRRPPPSPTLARSVSFDDVRSMAIVQEPPLENMTSAMYIGSAMSIRRRKRGRRRASTSAPASATSMKALIACGCLLGVATVSAFRGTLAVPPRLNVHDTKNRQNARSVPSLSGWAALRSDGSSSILMATPPTASAAAAAASAAPINRGLRSDCSTSSSGVGSSSSTGRGSCSGVISVGRGRRGSRRPVTRTSMVAVMEPPHAATRETAVVHTSSKKCSGGAPGPEGASGTSSSRKSDSEVRELGGVPPAGMANPITPVGLRLVPTSSTTGAKEARRRRGKRRRGDEPGAMARVLPERSPSDKKSEDGDGLQPFTSSKKWVNSAVTDLRVFFVVGLDVGTEFGSCISLWAGPCV